MPYEPAVHYAAAERYIFMTEEAFKRWEAGDFGYHSGDYNLMCHARQMAVAHASMASAAASLLERVDGSPTEPLQ